MPLSVMASKETTTTLDRGTFTEISAISEIVSMRTDQFCGAEEHRMTIFGTVSSTYIRTVCCTCGMSVRVLIGSRSVPTQPLR